MTLADKMWTWNYIGLYAQYAAVGLLYGMSGMSLNFCVYYYEGNRRHQLILHYYCLSPYHEPPTTLQSSLIADH
jgi:hypothetical protein